MKRLFFLIPSIALSCCTSVEQHEKNESDFLNELSSGNICLTDKQIPVNTLTWNPHAKFEGVFMKNLITGGDTGGALSCHIVKVEPGCILDTHLHAGKLELHEVVEGGGTLFLDGREFDYTVGVVGVIPADTPHKVVAGPDGLVLLAKFTPALE